MISYILYDKYNNRRDKPLILYEVVRPPTFQRVANVWGWGDSLTQKHTVMSYQFLLNHK